MKPRYFLLLFLAGMLCLPGRLKAQAPIFSATLSNPEVTCFAQDSTGHIWIGTARGLNRFNGATYTAYYASGDDGSLNSDHILALCYDKEGTLWIGTECGLNWYREGRFHHMNQTVYDPVFKIEELDSTSISVAGKSGVFCFDKQTLALIRYEADTKSMTDSSEPASFVDRDGGLWGASPEGGWTYTARNQPYRTLAFGDGGGRISHPVFDKEGYLWLRIGGSLSSVDPESGQIIYQDTRHNCGGVFLNRDDDIVALFDGSFTQEFSVHNGIPTLIRTSHFDNTIFSIQEDGDGNLWLSEASYLIKLERNSRRTRYEIGFEHPFSYIIPCQGTNRIFILGLRDGVLEVNTEDGSVSQFGDGFQNVSAIMEARDGTFWMGTYNDGLIHYDEALGTVERFTSEDGIISSSIKSLTQDADGYIWFSSAMHVSRYDHWSRTVSVLHDTRYNLTGKSYDLISAVRGPDGQLYFGGSGGMTVVRPSAYEPRTREIPIHLEALSVNDTLLNAVPAALKLSYNENTLGFRFAGIDYSAGQLLNYTWQLEGYEKQWHSGSMAPSTTYTRIPAGKYTFRARVREQNGPWSTSEIALPIEIRPAPWASPWAKTAYVLLAFAALLAGGFAFLRIRLQKAMLSVSRQQQEIKQQHIDFMTNLSHEFRTPLSMIYAPVKELSKHTLSHQDRQLVGTIERNAEQLRALAEQLLSSSGARKDLESLTLRKNDLVSVVRAITRNFGYAVQEKEQTLTEDFPESLIGYFDTEKVSKVVGNLVSNAVKYTPEGGSITVRVRTEGPEAVISVEDNGIGIAEDKRDRIFDRFERLGAEKAMPETVGSGIGLNYAQTLAQLHHGSLTYSPNQPQGSVFTFTLPVTEEAYPDERIQGSEPIPEVPEMDQGGKKEGVILIAEDNLEVRIFLCQLFAPRYQVIPASNGMEAIDNLNLSIPDLVLSDVIMPGKSGISLCNDIKTSEDWSHIPVILLTAKADAESGVEGLQSGADAYIAKPFHPDFLKATVESLLENRRKVQQRILNLTSTTARKPGVLASTGMNEEEARMLHKLHEQLDLHLDDETFSVQDLAREMAMSYSSLYQKLKALTGNTPLQFVSTYRMNIALELLQDPSLSVTDVAEKVGSASPFTFSREFKRHFGFPPSQAREKA